MILQVNTEGPHLVWAIVQKNITEQNYLDEIALTELLRMFSLAWGTVFIMFFNSIRQTALLRGSH